MIKRQEKVGDISLQSVKLTANSIEEFEKRFFEAHNRWISYTHDLIMKDHKVFTGLSLMETEG